MDFEQLADVTLESSIGLFVVVLAYKLYRLRCGSHSKSRCCHDQLEVSMDMENAGHGSSASPMVSSTV